MVDGGGYILAVGGRCWVVVDIFWLVVGGDGGWHSLVQRIWFFKHYTLSDLGKLDLIVFQIA